MDSLIFIILISLIRVPQQNSKSITIDFKQELINLPFNIVYLFFYGRNLVSTKQYIFVILKLKSLKVLI